MVEVKKKTYTMEYDRAGCIGAAACVAVDDKTWQIIDDGKATITKDNVQGAKTNLEKCKITEEELELQLEAAKSCPVNVIHIIDDETGERLI